MQLRNGKEIVAGELLRRLRSTALHRLALQCRSAVVCFGDAVPRSESRRAPRHKDDRHADRDTDAHHRDPG